MTTTKTTKQERRLSWKQLEEIISHNDLEALFRTPSDYAKYQECKKQFAQQEGGTVQYILKHRLQWVDADDPSKDSDVLLSKIIPSGSDFLTDARDVKILKNDFPYAVELGVEHVVVWSKKPSPKREDGYISDKARELIAYYVTKTFVELLGMDPKDILWFRNTTALQSVTALEHFHVLLRNPDQQGLERLIGTAGYLDSPH